MREGLSVLSRGIRDEKRLFGLAVLASSIFGAGTAATGWAVGHVTDEILAPAFAAGSLEGVGLGGGVVLLATITLTTSVAVGFRRIFAGMVSTNLMARYRRRVGSQFLRLPLSWHHRHPAGQLLSNASSDVEASFMIFNPLPFALGVVVMIVVSGVVMTLADPVLAVVGLTVIPVLVAANVLYQRVMSPKVVRAQQLRAEVAAVAHESFDGALVVKAMGREADETTRFADATDRLRAAAVNVGRTRGVFDPLVESLPTLGTLAVLAIGTARVASGAAEAGDVVQVAYLLTLLAFPVRAFGWVLGDLPRCAVGFGRVRSVLEATGEMGYGTGKPGREGPAALRLNDIDYAYSAGGSVDLAAGADEAGRRELPVLFGVDLEVAAGSTVAVVGPTGSGKSTLTSLMVRLVDPGSGTVRLDATDVRELRPGGVASVAALVPQTTFVFDDTVRGNVTLGLGEADGVTDEGVRDALRLAQADRFVDALPDGLDTRVGERGASLSGGQRQRLALARAVVRQPRLLVLDDATSAVDPRVEQDILTGLRDAVTGLTVVVVAYRKATISLADEVVYVEHGRVVARGRHEDLLDSQPRYRHLVNAYEEEAATR